MTRIATHSKIVEFHKAIATAHKGINGFYRFDITELTNKLRSGVQTPVLMLESHSTDLAPNANKTVTFANRRISFLLMNFAGKTDNYDLKEQVLDELEVIALDICTYLKKCSDDTTTVWSSGKCFIHSPLAQPHASLSAYLHRQAA